MATTDFNPKTVAEASEASDHVPYGADDAGAIPKGQIDPVYEAKARVLNRAVSTDHLRERRD